MERSQSAGMRVKRAHETQKHVGPPRNAGGVTSNGAVFQMDDAAASRMQASDLTSPIQPRSLPVAPQWKNKGQTSRLERWL